MAEVNAIIGPHNIHGIYLLKLKIATNSLIDGIPGVRDTLEIFFGEPPSTPQEYIDDVLEFAGPERVHLRGVSLEVLIAFMKHKHDFSSKVAEFSAQPPLGMGNRCGYGGGKRNPSFLHGL